MNLNLILLDGAQGLIIVPFLFLLHVGGTVLIEGAILRYFQYATRRKCFTDAFIINLCSLIMGLFFFQPFFRLVEKFEHDYSRQEFMVIGLFYLQTIICEGLLLRLLNKTFPVKKLVIATLLMNLITYIGLCFIIYFLQS